MAGVSCCGSEPLWSRDGRELFYRNQPGKMVAVRVETESGFSTTTLFADTAFRRNDAHRQYDLTSDGKRFITPGIDMARARFDVVRGSDAVDHVIVSPPDVA